LVDEKSEQMEQEAQVPSVGIEHNESETSLQHTNNVPAVAKSSIPVASTVPEEKTVPDSLVVKKDQDQDQDQDQKS
jgi:hypothetical protein